MYREIIKIRVKKSRSTTTEDIYRIKLSTGVEQPIAVVISKMRTGVCYYYRTKESIINHLKISDPLYKDPYIKTKRITDGVDPILLLPKF